MIAKNYYNVLGLNPSCAPQDIKKSYHKLALVWHPDKHNNKIEAQSKFTEINEAYSILADSKKRMIYDTCGLEGLVMDQDLQDFANCNQDNTFYQKGFQGTDKSAFDVLRDIFEESDDEDDDFFDDCNLFNLSENFKDNIKAFIDENIIPSETEEGDNMFKNYIPTFMDADFFCEPPSLFEQIIPDEDDLSAHSEFFTYFTTTVETDGNFSKKSKKNKNSRNKKSQKLEDIYEEAEFIEFELGPQPSKRTKNDKSKYVEEVVLEDFAELFEKTNHKENQKKSKKQNKQSKNAQESGKTKGRLHSELDGEEEKGKKYSQKNQKKNKK